MMTQDDKAALHELMASKVREPVPKAVDSPSRDADLQCSNCGAFVTFDGAEIDPARFSPACRACAETASKARANPVSLLKKPVFYVACLTVWAVILWAMGWGNNSVAATQRADTGKEWFEKRYAANLVLQRERASARAAYLDEAGKTKDAALWWDLSRRAALKAAEEWDETPAEAVMRFMAATSAMRAGDADTAYAEMVELSDSLGKGEDAVCFRYHRGLCALEAGEAQAAKEDLDGLLAIEEQSLVSLERMFGKSVDKMIERAEKGVDPKANLMDRLTEMAGLRTPKSEMIEGTVKAYLEHGIDHPELEYWKRKTGLDAPKDVTARGKSGTVVFEEIDEDEN